MSSFRSLFVANRVKAFAALCALSWLAGPATASGAGLTPHWVADVGRSGGDAGQSAITAEYLADGSLIVLSKDGGFVRASRFDPSGDLSSESLLDLPRVGTVLADIDAFGRVAVACTIPVGAAGDLWLMKYDGHTGSRLWAQPAIHASVNSTTADFPVAVFFDRAGDVVVVAGVDTTASDSTVALKYAGTTGTLRWGPTPLLSGIATAALVDSANAVLAGGQYCTSSSNCDLALAKVSSAGIRTWGPVLYSSGSEIDTFGGIAVDEGGNVYITGAVPKNSNMDAVALSYSGATGILRWGPIFFDEYPDPPGTDYQTDVGRRVTVDAAGAVLVAVSSNSSVVALKYASANGALVWASSAQGVGGDALPAFLTVDGAGDLAVAGTRSSAVSDDVFLLRFTGIDGQPTFGPNYFGAAGDDRVAAALLGADGDVAVVATLVNADATTDTVVLKYHRLSGDPIGSPWVSGSGANLTDDAIDLAVDQTGNTVALLKSSLPGQSDYLVVKLSFATGSPLWGPVVLDVGQADIPVGVEVDGLGDVLVAGSSRNASGNYDLMLAKLAGADGAVLWGPVLWDGGQNADDLASALAVDPAGNPVLVGGAYAGTARRDDFVVLSLNGNDGSLRWIPVTYNGPNSGYDRARAVGVDAVGDIVVSGTAFVSDGTTNEDVVSLKYAGATGSLLWGPKFTKGGTARYDSVASLKLRANGDAFLLVSSRSGIYYDAYDLVVASLDGVTGAIRWGPTTFASSYFENPVGLEFNAAGDLLVASTGTSSGTGRVLALCYAAGNGALLWGPVYSSESVTPKFAAADASGDLLVAGTIVDAGENAYDTFLAAFDGATGTEKWFATSIDTQYSDTPKAVTAAPGGLILAASLEGSSWSRSRIAHLTAGLAISTLQEQLAPAACGMAYSDQLSAANGDDVYTWSLASGELPPGLSLTAQGAIEGTPLAQGHFDFVARVADGAGAQRDAAFALGVFRSPAPQSFTVAPQPVCQGAAAELTAPAGYPGYLWYPGELLGQVVHLAAQHPTPIGVVLDDGTCTYEATGTLRVTPSQLVAPVITPSGPASFCAGGSVTLDSSPAAVYLWSTGETTQSIVVSTVGSYSVTVSDAAGCSAESLPIATDIIPAPSADIVAPASVCGGTTGHLASVPDGGVGASYEWSLTNGAITAGDGTASITFSAGPSGPVFLGVIVTSAAGCSTSGSSAVPVNPEPAATITAPAALCTTSGGNNASVPDAGPGAAYVWTIANGTISSGAETNTIVFTAGSPGDLLLGVNVNSAAGCSTSGDATIAINTSPLAGVIAPASACANSTGIIASVADAGPGATYAWTITNGAIGAGQGTSAITFTAGNSGATRLDVTVNSPAGCVATGGASVAVDTVPSATVTAPTSACANSEENAASVADAGIAATYAWSITNGTVTSGAGTNAIIFTAGDSGATSLDVIITNIAGCATAGSAAVALDAPPSAAITTAPITCADSGNNTASVADAGPGASYSWNILNGTITAGEGTPAITFSAGANGPVSLSVSVQTAPGCAASSAVDVAVAPLPGATVTAPTTTCADSPANTASVPDAGVGATYAWSIDNGTIAAGQGTNSITFTAGSAGTVSIGATVTSAAGCTAAGGAAVAINALPPAVVTAPAAVCSASSGNSASVPDAGPGASYAWTIANGIVTAGLGTNSITFTAGTSGSVTIDVTVTTGDGCSATGGADVVINPLPSATVTAPVAACASSAGNTASVADAGPAATYAWMIANGTITGGLGTRSVTFTAGSAGSTTLGVTVTTASGCSAQGGASVAINAPPSAAITAPPAVCRNSAGNAASVPDAGGGATYAWTIFGGTITAGSGTRAVTFTAGPSGAVSLGVTVTSAAGCQAAGSAPVPIDQTPVATITAASSVCSTSAGNAASVADAGGGATYTWTITNGTITSGAGTRQIAFTAGTSGSVTLGVTVRTLGGCQATASKPVTINALPSATITAPTSVPRNSKNKAASVPTAGTGATYVWSITNGTITSGQGTRAIKFSAGSTPGTLTLTVVVTKSNGCSKTGTKNVTVT